MEVPGPARGRRLRQLLRAALVLAIGLAVAASALAIWCLASLNGLPDIGDPFDVAALRAFSISEDRDACVFFRRANEKRSSFPSGWTEKLRPRRLPDDGSADLADELTPTVE